MTSMPSNLSIASLIFQTAWVAFITFLIWYGLVQRYSANRLAALTFLTPLFGVAAGYLILDEPLTARFLIAVAMVTVGTLLPRLPDGREALRRVRSRKSPEQPVRPQPIACGDAHAARISRRICLKISSPPMG